MLQSQDVQTFLLEKSRIVDNMKLVVENTFGGKNSGGNFKILGLKCQSPGKEAKDEKKKSEETLGIKEEIKEVGKTCMDTMDGMESDKSKIYCIESCPELEDRVKVVGIGLFTLDSSVCTAAKFFYKGKEEYNNKNFGIVRLPNKTKIDGAIPPYVFTFDNSIVKTEVK